MTDRAELICVVGPTGVGKTAFSLALAEGIDGEIINADSRQLYRRLDIGTAKPTAEERARVPHHLIDVADPLEPFSTGQYCALADAAIADIQGRGKVPVVVGGTGLYVRALIDGLWDGPTANPSLRAALEGVESAAGEGTLHHLLGRLDPDSATRIHPNDRYKTIRALEITLLCRQPASEARAAHGFPGRYRALLVGLTCPKEVLHQRIEARVQQMVADGWLAEVTALLESGIGPDAPAMNAVGYRQICAHLHGKSSLTEALEATILATRKYAKRQFTWFRKDDRLTWLNTTEAPMPSFVSTVISAFKRGAVRVDVPVCKAP